MSKGSISKEFILGALIFLSAVFIFSIGTRSMSLSSPDEKRYIQSAEEMVETGDWITPRYHGRPRFQKPILFYWLAALSMSFFGTGWFGARFPSAACGALTILITYLLGKSMYNKRTGLFSASLLAASAIFFTYSRLSTPDMTTIFFITLSIFVFFKLYFQDAPKMAGYLFFIALALAALSKGLVGFLIPLITITIFTFMYKKKFFKRTDIILGSMLFLLITLPWFVIMVKIHGNVYMDHIWQVETMNRMSGLWSSWGNAIFKTSKNLVRYLIMTFIVFLPASVFLPGAVIDIIKRKSTKREDVLIFLWLLTVIIFFTLIGTKKTHYLLTLAPPICILMGRYLADITKDARYLKTIQIFITCSIFIFVFTFGHLIPMLNRDNGLLMLSEKILSMVKEGDTVGVGSHFISHNRLDLYLGINIKKVNVDLYDPEEQIATSRRLLVNFLNKEDRVFCLIIRQDYEEYIPDKLKRRVFILDKGWYWKKPNQIELDKESTLSILKKDKTAFNRFFKNEIYLISNKR